MLSPIYFVRTVSFRIFFPAGNVSLAFQPFSLSASAPFEFFRWINSWSLASKTSRGLGDTIFPHDISFPRLDFDHISKFSSQGNTRLAVSEACTRYDWWYSKTRYPNVQLSCISGSVEVASTTAERSGISTIKGHV